MKKNRWISLLVVSGLCMSFTGCIGNFYENIGSVDGREISSGLYLNLQYDAYNLGYSMLEDAEQDPFDQEIEGLSFEDWLSQETDRKLREYVAIERLSAENEVVLSEESLTYRDQLSSYWDFSSESYTENGISYDTMMRTTTIGLLKDDLFTFYYGPDGELAKSDEEIRADYDEQFGTIEYISLPFNTLSDPVEEKEDEVMAVAEELRARLEAGDAIEDVAADGVEQVYEITGREFLEDSASTAVATNYLEFAGGEDDEYYPTEFRTGLQEMAEGDVGIHKMGSTLLVYRRVPNFESDEAFDTERSNVVRRLYQDEFDEFLVETYEGYPLEFTFGARSYLSPKKIV